MSIESDIITAFKTLLPDCNTVDSNYRLDWTHVSFPDDEESPVSIAQYKPNQFPCIGIGFPEEYSESQDSNVINRSNLITCYLWCIPKQKNATRQDVDDIIKDIKRFIGQNHSLNGTVFHAWYDRYNRFTNQISARQYGVQITLKIRYFEDKLNP